MERAPRRKAEAMRGKMLWFNGDKDLGYIASDEGDRVPVHGSGFVSGAGPSGRCNGIVVEFRVDELAGQPTAQEVTLVPEVMPRRARRRTR